MRARAPGHWLDRLLGAGMWAATVGTILAVTMPAQAAPPGPRDPDWPCQQIKVAQLSVAALWAGPALDQAQATWKQDATVSALVARLAQRRVSMDDARAEIADFASSTGPLRQEKLLALFAGLFETLDQERAAVVNGLDRYGNQQKSLADKVRGEADAMHAEQAAPNPDTQKLATLGNEVGWDTRVFEDRRQSIRYACDVPNTIEQRLFSLSQAIQAALG